MQVNDLIFKELIKRGYSLEGKTRVWNVADSKLWYLTPELSKGFLNLFKYEPYRKAVIDTEINLIKKHTSHIIQKFGNKKFNLIDLGCGSGKKTSEFVKNLPSDVKLLYSPVDISKYFIDKSIEEVKNVDSNRVEKIKPFVSDFKDFDDIIGALRSVDYQDNIVLLLGETLSHYDINELLHTLSEPMFSGDILIIGNGYRVGKRFVAIEKYKDSLFNEWFINIMRGLSFKDSEVEYDVRFANDRLEAFYKILADKTVSLGGKKVEFKKGDEVVVATQNKMFLDELKKFCKMYFSEVEILADEQKEYCLVVCKK